MTAFDQSITELDTSIFQIESQTSIDDRRSLLAIQNAVRQWKPKYSYLECGSHFGGSLLPHVLDPRCELAYSIDTRPQTVPDDAVSGFHIPKTRPPACLRRGSLRML